MAQPLDVGAARRPVFPWLLLPTSPCICVLCQLARVLETRECRIQPGSSAVPTAKVLAAFQVGAEREAAGTHWYVMPASPAACSSEDRPFLGLESQGNDVGDILQFFGTDNGQRVMFMGALVRRGVQAWRRGLSRRRPATRHRLLLRARVELRSPGRTRRKREQSLGRRDGAPDLAWVRRLGTGSLLRGVGDSLADQSQLERDIGMHLSRPLHRRRPCDTQSCVLASPRSPQVRKRYPHVR